jgi:hypothetical protein
MDYNMGMAHTLNLHPKLSNDPFAPEVWILTLASEEDSGLESIWQALSQLFEKTRVYLLIVFHQQEQITPKLLRTLLHLEELACESDLRTFWCELPPAWRQVLQEQHLETLLDIYSTRSKALLAIKSLWEEEKQLFGDIPA